MTIDLNKILARQDYVKMTKLLREKCDKVEGVISSKMEELELDGTDKGIVVNNTRILCVKGFLFIRTPEKEEEAYGAAEYRQIVSEDNDVTNVTDYKAERHFGFYPCSHKHALRFLNNAVAIIEELGKIEQEKVDAISKALEAAEKL